MKETNKQYQAAVLAPIVLFLAGCYGSESGEDGGSTERMHNAAIVIVTAIAAQDVIGTGEFQATVERPMDFDSKIKGTVSPAKLDARMIIPLKDNIFVAEKVDGMWKGEQRKLAFNWKVEQVDAATYEIQRIGFDGKMNIRVDEGRIEGVYERKWAMDIRYTGSIDENGEYQLTLHRPLSWDWEVTGQVTAGGKQGEEEEPGRKPSRDNGALRRPLNQANVLSGSNNERPYIPSS